MPGLICHRFANQWRQCLCVAFLVFLLLIETQTCTARNHKHCPPSSCGNIRNISYPFRLANDKKRCGERRYTLYCENSQTLLNLSNGKYRVQAINYHNFTIRLVDINVDKNNCSTLPRVSLFQYNFSDGRMPYTWIYRSYYDVNKPMVLISCPNRVKIDSGHYIDPSHCIKGSRSSYWNQYSYVSVGDLKVSSLMDSCSVGMVAAVPDRNYTGMTFIDIHKELAFGFELSWHGAYCKRCLGGCYVNESQVLCYFHSDDSYSYSLADELVFFVRKWGIWKYLRLNLVLLDIVKILKADLPSYLRHRWFWKAVIIYLVFLHVAIKICVAPCIFAFLIYKFRRRRYSAYDAVEDFLHNHNNLMPIRYSYSDIKKITRNFTDKLGQGGFGSVYKGTLRSGHLAAIKILGKSKSGGQDFINEVATIGRIHHTNVVRLIGFCAEGSKRALVYDFMPNGSLDKYIFAKEGYVSLTCEKLYDISLGIARGIEYLHRGCEMQILHFDIKPHNILLDENFSPKLSDFGLAKLYPTTNSIVTITAAKGTIGYMAPELFYKNIGNVSNKADVYSFGMLLLEMAGKRKNLNAMAEDSSEVYFPNWIYDQLAKGKDVEISDGTEEENKTIKKMIIVGLWCIQMRPTNRPSMSKVIEMLEIDLETLQLPPRSLSYLEETEAPISDTSYAESISFDHNAVVSLSELISSTNNASASL